MRAEWQAATVEYRIADTRQRGLHPRNPDRLYPYDIRGVKCTLIVIIDTGTGYSECDIVEKKSIDTIIQAVDQLWICRHGTPHASSADDEYHRPRLQRFFESYEISFKPRPTRRHNKIGFVERKNGTIKNIAKRLMTDNTNSAPQRIIGRAMFLSNMLSGSQIIRSFQLVRGYQPAILGIPSSEISQGLLNAHTELMAATA